MQKWQILIIGAGPSFPTVEQANELVGQMLEQGLNLKQAVFTGDSPGESANLLDERDQKTLAGKDITIKPRKTGLVHAEMFEQVKAERDEAHATIEALNKKVEMAASEAWTTAKDLEKRLLEMQNANIDLAQKLEAATAASPLAASAVADHEGQPEKPTETPDGAP
jgi:hypothetical protein